VPGQPLSAEPAFSVVIPTQGRPKTLERTLDYLLRCDPPPYEVVVVDGDGSSKGVVEAARSNGGPTIQHLQGGQPRAYNRNLGAERSTGDVVVFLDDDARAMPRLFAALARAYRDPAVVGVTGRVIEPGRRRFGGVSSRVRRLLFPGGRDGTMTGFGYPRRIVEPEREWDVEWMQGCLMSARRDAAVQTRLDERMPSAMDGEDEDFAYRLSRLGRVRYLPNAMVIHELLGLTSKHRDQRRFDRDVVIARTYLLRKNFRITPLVALQFAALLGVLIGHRLVNREWSGVLGLLDGIGAVWRERHTPLDRFIAACRGRNLGVD
jgi:GT2 family glycosyltransferase